MRGADPELVKRVTSLHTAFKEGSLEALTEEWDDGLPGIVVGMELANQLGLYEGDIVTVVSPWGKLGPFGITPAFKQFRVVGIFSIGLLEIDSAVVYTTLDAA